MAGYKDNSKWVTNKDITKECAQGQLSFLLYSKELQSQAASILPTNLPTNVQAILQQYPSVTNPTPPMPHERSCDYKILLIPNSKPTCLRPYRHSYYIKNELEKLIQEMLEA